MKNIENQPKKFQINTTRAGQYQSLGGFDGAQIKVPKKKNVNIDSKNRTPLYQPKSTMDFKSPRQQPLLKQNYTKQGLKSPRAKIE